MELPYFRLLMLLLLSTGPFCTAQTETEANKTLLWEISSPGLQKPSYLFGTIHLICPDDYIWTDVMEKSFAATDEVCLEMDMDDPALMMEIAIGMVDNSGKKLKDYFTEEQYKKIAAFVRDSMGMEIGMFQQMKPAALYTLFATKTVSCSNPLAYEVVLADEARSQNKEVVGLETASEQLELFDNQPGDSMTYELVLMTEGYEEKRKEYQNLVSIYQQQDLPALHRYIQRSKDTGGQLHKFLDLRNEKWIERMVDRMDRASVFFAVGAGHLWGEQGLISLLRKEGYTVRPVK